MTLRATSTLAENAEGVLARFVDAIRTAGYAIEIVADTEVQADDAADLQFSCGLMTILGISEGNGRTIIAAPHFPGESGPTYRSVVIARWPISIVDAVTLGLAVNEYGSWSGWQGYREFVEGRGLAVNVDHLLTGSHIASIDAVRAGDADLACIDATIWRELADHRDLHVIATTRDWPAPPLSLASTLEPATREAIASIVLGLADVSPADESDYAFMLTQLQR